VSWVIKLAINEIVPGKPSSEQSFKATDADHSGVVVLVGWNFPTIDDSLPELVM
jgi:hypothetical protein